jgi:hypothetical protein
VYFQVIFDSIIECLIFIKMDRFFCVELNLKIMIGVGKIRGLFRFSSNEIDIYKQTIAKYAKNIYLHDLLFVESTNKTK